MQIDLPKESHWYQASVIILIIERVIRQWFSRQVHLSQQMIIFLIIEHANIEIIQLSGIRHHPSSIIFSHPSSTVIHHHQISIIFRHPSSSFIHHLQSSIGSYSSSIIIKYRSSYQCIDHHHLSIDHQSSIIIKNSIIISYPSSDQSKIILMIIIFRIL